VSGEVTNTQVLCGAAAVFGAYMVALWILVAEPFPYTPHTVTRTEYLQQCESWMFNEELVCERRGFTHEEYLEWLKRQ